MRLQTPMGSAVMFQSALLREERYFVTRRYQLAAQVSIRAPT